MSLFSFLYRKTLTQPGLACLAATCAFSFSPNAQAATRILPLGDSITFGVGSSDDNGYRGPLQALLHGTDADFDFVGTLQNGTVDIDQDHYSIPGIKAWGFGNVSTGLLENLDADNVFPTLTAATEQPDIILLHIGTNTITAGGNGGLAGTELDGLLRALTTTNSGSSFYIGADGDHDIRLARVIPKADDPLLANPHGGAYSALTKHQARVKSTFDYNYGGPSNSTWTNGLDDVITNRSQYDGRIELVDMFRIDVDSLNLQHLLDDFGASLGVTTTAEVRALLSPEDDTLNGNEADWVDWVLNYDEVNNAFGAGTDGVNTNLYAPGDNIHPGDLGYAVMAQVWFNDGGLDFILGDINGDGFVGLDDINYVLANWNQNVTAGDELSGELTNDGFVGIDDLNIILSNWNAGTLPSPPAANAIVPEPATLALLMAASLSLVRRAR